MLTLEGCTLLHAAHWSKLNRTCILVGGSMAVQQAHDRSIARAHSFPIYIMISVMRLWHAHQLPGLCTHWSQLAWLCIPWAFLHASPVCRQLSQSNGPCQKPTSKGQANFARKICIYNSRFWLFKQIIDCHVSSYEQQIGTWALLATMSMLLAPGPF